jgi:hypothetical protein
MVNRRLLNSNELADTLSIDRLHLPLIPRVLGIQVNDYEDADGEEALDLFVILADDLPEDETLYGLVAPVFAAIRNALQEAGESRFAYISAGTRADLQARQTIANDDED